MTPEQRSENARKAANARWSKGVRPLPKRTLERMYRELAKETPEEKKRLNEEFAQRFSGFLKVYKDRPMA